VVLYGAWLPYAHSPSGSTSGDVILDFLALASGFQVHSPECFDPKSFLGTVLLRLFFMQRLGVLPYDEAFFPVPLARNGSVLPPRVVPMDNERCSLSGTRCVAL